MNLIKTLWQFRPKHKLKQEVEMLRLENLLLRGKIQELENGIHTLRLNLHEAQKKNDKLTEELNEIQSEFLILVNAKTLSRKEARALKNHKEVNQ